MADNNDAAVIVEQTQLAQQPKLIDKTPFLVLTDHQKAASLESYLEKPLNHRGEVVSERVETFIDYVNEFKNARSRFYIYGASRSTMPKFGVVIDDRGKDRPEWGRFKVTFSPSYSRQYNAWNEHEGRWLNPARFAEIINKNRLYVVSHDAADLIEILRDIKGTANVQFSEASDEYTGAKSSMYAEKVTLKGGKANVDIPTSFAIGIPIYERQQNRVKIDCHIKAKVDEGNVMFCYEFDMMDEIVEAMVDTLGEEITKGIDLKPYYANPPFQG